VSAIYHLNPVLDLLRTQILGMMSQSAVCLFDQGEGHSLRLNNVCLYYVSALYMLTPW